MPIDIADPRLPAARGAGADAVLLDLAAESLAATSASRADAIGLALAGELALRLRSGAALRLAETLAAAPSVAVARALWRQLIEAWAIASRPAAGDAVAVRLFALPLVVIAGSEESALRPASAATIAGVLPDTERLAAILREHGALAGNQTFGLATALVGAEALDVPHWSELLGWQNLAGRRDGGARDLPPAPIAVSPGQQSVHLRFLIGTALAAGETDILAAGESGWAVPFAQELARQLAAPGIAVLALPRPPQAPPAALQQGRAAQREIGAQLFASNAIRKLRAATGEPAAVISAHRAAAAPGGGELRLSLSSPFDPRAAEGFCCPLFPTDHAGDVAVMLVDLLRDCRIADVRVLAGVHADRDPQTGMTLLFKADALDSGAPAALH